MGRGFEIMFVISIKRLFDYSGTKIDKPEYEYFGYDRYAGSFSTGYPTWMDIGHAEKFETAEQAKQIYMKYLNIIDCSWDKYQRDSIRICEVKFKPVESLPWKVEKK